MTNLCKKIKLILNFFLNLFLNNSSVIIRHKIYKFAFC